MGCNCADCGQFNTASVKKPSGISEDLNKVGWLTVQLESMLKPEAALGDVAMPFSNVLNNLIIFADKDDNSRHTLCKLLCEGDNMLLLVKLCVGASDYLRWLGL